MHSLTIYPLPGATEATLSLFQFQTLNRDHDFVAFTRVPPVSFLVFTRCESLLKTEPTRPGADTLFRPARVPQSGTRGISFRSPYRRIHVFSKSYGLFNYTNGTLSACVDVNSKPSLLFRQIVRKHTHYGRVHSPRRQ